MEPITPTVGRVCYAHSSQWSGVRKADVLGVHGSQGDPEVSLSISLDPAQDADLIAAEGKTTLTMTAVRFYGEGSHRPESDPPTDRLFATWMGFQIGQAVRTQTAENQLGEEVEKLATRIAGVEDGLEGVRTLIASAVESVEGADDEPAPENPTTRPVNPVTPPLTTRYRYEATQRCIREAMDLIRDAPEHPGNRRILKDLGEASTQLAKIVRTLS